MFCTLYDVMLKWSFGKIITDFPKPNPIFNSKPKPYHPNPKNIQFMKSILSLRLSENITLLICFSNSNSILSIPKPYCPNSKKCNLSLIIKGLKRVEKYLWFLQASWCIWPAEVEKFLVQNVGYENFKVQNI